MICETRSDWDWALTCWVLTCWVLTCSVLTCSVLTCWELELVELVELVVLLLARAACTAASIWLLSWLRTWVTTELWPVEPVTVGTELCCEEVLKKELESSEAELELNDELDSSEKELEENDELSPEDVENPLNWPS